MSIEIANESGVDVDEALLAGLARHVLDDMRVHPLAELSVLLVDEPAVPLRPSEGVELYELLHSLGHDSRLAM